MKNTDGIHPKLKELIDLTIEAGAKFKVTEGLRSAERQAELVAQGKSKTLDGKHLVQADGFGHAFDVVPIISEEGEKEQISWEWDDFYALISIFAEQSVKVDAQFTWGGVWDRRLSKLDSKALQKEVEAYAARRRKLGKKPFLDGPHIQLEG